MYYSKEFLLWVIFVKVSSIYLAYALASDDSDEEWVTSEPLSYNGSRGARTVPVLANDDSEEWVTSEPLSYNGTRGGRAVVHNLDYKEKYLELFAKSSNKNLKKRRRREVLNEEYKFNISGIEFHKTPDSSYDGTPNDLLGDVPDDPISWIDDTLLWHNKFRKRHGVKDLILDYKLAYEAKVWADHIGDLSEQAGKPVLKQTTADVGENIASRRGKDKTILHSLPGAFPVQYWYKEIRNHNWANNYFQMNSGHFTQVVWAVSRRVGCGKTITDNKILLVVCRYLPPGNYLEKAAFKSHVVPPVDGGPNKIPDLNSL